MNPAESTTNSTRTVPPSWRTADSEGYFLALLIFAEASDVHSCHVRGTCGGGEEVWATLGQDGIQIARKNSADAEKLAVRTERPLTIGPRLLSLTSQDPFSIRYVSLRHRSPGHQTEGGSVAEILVGLSATKQLRLYG